MYHSYYSEHHYFQMFAYDPAFSVFFSFVFAFFGALVGLGAAALATVADSTPQAMRTSSAITGLATLAVSIIAGTALLAGGMGEFSTAFMAAPFAYIAFSAGAVSRHRRDVNLALSVGRKLCADDGALLLVLDHDGDCVVSPNDVKNSEAAVVGALTTEEFGWLRCNLRQVGHNVSESDSTYVVGRKDLANLQARLNEQHKGWLA